MSIARFGTVARRGASVACRSVARQAHGFHYQDQVIKRLKLKSIAHYTAEYDAECQGTPVQIKCMKHQTGVQLGDFRRNRSKTHDFIMIIGFWEGDKYNIIDEDVRYVTRNEYTDNIGFHDEGNTIERRMFEDMSYISNDYSDDGVWTEFRTRYKALWPATNNIDLRFARDHKKQKRIQCGMSNKKFEQWYKSKFEAITL